MVIQRVNKPKTKRGKRHLQEREPKVHENTKKTMFVKGGQTSALITNVLKQFYLLKKPFATHLKKKNIMRPFDDYTPLEYLSQHNDHSLFMFGSHSKKRQNNLIIGRMYDYHVLDMFEFGIDKFISMEEFKTAKITLGTKPCLVFNGEQFDSDPELARLKSLLIDFFKGETVDNIRLQGVEHSYNFTINDGKLYVRSYRVNYKKSETKIPNIELEEIGPSLDLSIRRTKIASDDLLKQALKQPKEITKKPPKNVSQDAFGSTLGRIHMEKQDFGKLQTRKMKGLKRKNDAPETQEKTNKRLKTIQKLAENIQKEIENDDEK